MIMTDTSHTVSYKKGVCQDNGNLFGFIPLPGQQTPESIALILI